MDGGKDLGSLLTSPRGGRHMGLVTEDSQDLSCGNWGASDRGACSPAHWRNMEVVRAPAGGGLVCVLFRTFEA